VPFARGRRPLTVLGEPIHDDYAYVLAHEHVFIDIRCWTDTDSPVYAELGAQAVTADNAARVRANPFACPDNIVLSDPRIAEQELGALPPDGLLVDVTPDELGGAPGLLARVSERTGIDIVTGCGLYIDAAWSSRHGDAPTAWFADRILRRFDSERPPAVIGEIGTGAPITAAEQRSLAGAAIAQRETGAPLYVHLHPWHPQGAQALDIVEENGGDLERTVLCHCDVTAGRQLDALEALLRRGCLAGFDIWGDDYDYGDGAMPADQERAATVAELIERGWGDRLVHSQDVCEKTQLRRWGGAGYGHVPRDLPGLLRERGVAPEEIDRQLSGNMLRLLRG
jgi:phosphotriesterase-related protein